MSKRNLVYLISAYALLALVLTSARATSHHHSVSISDGYRRPITDCSDLRIRFDEQDAVVRSEEHNLTKSEAPVLRIHPHANGGVQVVGWDKDTYSVTACKAAEGRGDAAERILSQIIVSIEKGKISTKGPGSDEEWTVYLLIRAPKSASIDLDTENGPISLYDVDGKLTARAHNGPISLKNFSGDADITATNGPISLEGTSGSVHIYTENGPISVALKGKTWSGTGLSADAQNGPLTLLVPAGYQSSFVVESRNHAPVSCQASICDNARRTWDDENRRIEYGAAPAVIHLSTVNGPVSVKQLTEKL
jgi:DUF4097 and DUF4098 domain-containing protein YvlB